MFEYVGRVVELQDMRAIAPDGVEIRASGRYRVDEFEPEDRSVGIFGNDFLLVPEHAADEEWERVAIAVDVNDLLPILDPARVKRERREEAEFELGQIEDALAHGDLSRRELGWPLRLRLRLRQLSHPITGAQDG